MASSFKASQLTSALSVDPTPGLLTDPTATDIFLFTDVTADNGFAAPSGAIAAAGEAPADIADIFPTADTAFDFAVAADQTGNDDADRLDSDFAGSVPVQATPPGASLRDDADALDMLQPVSTGTSFGFTVASTFEPVGFGATARVDATGVIPAFGSPLDSLDGGGGVIASVLGGAARATGSIVGAANSVLGPAVAAVLGGGVSPFVINVTYDSSVANAPAAFKAAVQSVVQYLESQFTDAVTMNITIGYGEAGGTPLGGSLGTNLSFLNSYTYAQLNAALIADSKSVDDLTSVATLSPISPVNGTYWVTRAEAKALGLLAPNTSIDGNVGFAAGNLFDYDNTDGVTAGQYDFFDVAVHELTEVMGRSLLVGRAIGTTPNGYEPLDLFHYSAAGARDFVGTQPGYFSLDGGITNLGSFNTTSGGDFGDWASSAGLDSFLAFSPSGVINPVSLSDVREMDILGWDRAIALLQPDLTASAFTFNGTALSFQIHNSGTGTAASSTAGVYLSADSVITSTDTLLATAATPALIPGASANEGGSLALPSNLVAGTYYLGALADSNGQIAESNEGNNGSNTVPVILGNNNNNSLTGTAGHDTMLGFDGTDTLNGGAGADTMLGGAGNDTYVVDNAGDLVVENANQGTDTVLASVSATLAANVEKLALTGSAAINGIGNSLNNVIAGNAGNNQLTGGGGSDQFVFNTALNASFNVDTITDFSHAAGDKIDLDHTIFSRLQPVALGSAIASRDFFASANGAAHLTTDHILYNTSNGFLSYDPDGAGAAAAVHFATVANHPALVASDFLLV